ncbi:hypothetical protein ACM64Y_02045 [Novispirillum sp. DQ9]|uniref:hypothetical protein n=1 Tax=Novispirillum sp. DQ9 TaxID=3398612 RepID=UPI003C7D1E4E
MIRILLIVFALILAMAGGVAGLIHFGVLPDYTGLIRPPVEEAAAPPPPPRVEPVFQHITPFLIPIIRNGQIERSLYIGLRLRVNPEKRSEVTLFHARLHDVYMRLLFELVPQQMEQRDTLDLAAMKVRLQEVADRLLGQGMIEEVMFQAVFER